MSIEIIDGVVYFYVRDDSSFFQKNNRAAFVKVGHGGIKWMIGINEIMT